MPLETMTFDRLDALLTSLGYRLSRSADHLAYLSEGRQPIYLPALEGTQVVPGMSLAAVESTLALDGVIHPQGLVAGLIRAAERSPEAAQPPAVKRPKGQPSHPRGIKL